MKIVSVYVDNKRKPIASEIVTDFELNHQLAHLTLKIDPDLLNNAKRVTVKISDGEA